MERLEALRLKTSGIETALGLAQKTNKQHEARIGTLEGELVSEVARREKPEESISTVRACHH